MFHPGRIISVFSGGKDEITADGVAQAVLLMWDENILTLEIHPKIRQRIKEGDVVLVDYRPADRLTVPVPKQQIVKIIRGKRGHALWTQYTEYHEKRKRSANRLPTAPPGYIG